MNIFSCRYKGEVITLYGEAQLSAWQLMAAEAGEALSFVDPEPEPFIASWPAPVEPAPVAPEPEPVVPEPVVPEPVEPEPVVPEPVVPEPVVPEPVVPVE